jgi:hypothetical protein
MVKIILNVYVGEALGGGVQERDVLVKASSQGPDCSAARVL